MLAYFKVIYAYREMIKSLVRQDLRGRYKASALGFLWTFINPLLQLLVYTLVFSVIMKNDIEQFYLFLFVALVPFIFFSSSLSGGANLILQQKDMIKKIYFPREVLPIAYTITNFINMLLCFLVVFSVLILAGRPPAWVYVYLPLIMAIEFVLCLGVTLLSSCCTVYFRDLEHILGILTMAWQFLTPIMYSIDIVPQELMGIYMLNPLTPIIVAYRDILYYRRPPNIETLALSVAMGLIVLVLGAVVFGRLKRNFVEEL